MPGVCFNESDGAVARLQARRADEPESRDQDRAVRERQERQEQPSGTPSAPRPRGRAQRAPTGSRASDHVRGDQERAHHEPVAHVRVRDLPPRERREREPREPPRPRIGCRSTRTRRRARTASTPASRRTAARSPCSMSDISIAEREPAGGGRQPRQRSLRRNQYSPSPARSGLRTMSARSPPPQPKSREEHHRGQRRATRSAGPRRTGTRSSRTGSTAGRDRRRALRAMNVKRGSQNDRMSGWWFVRCGVNAKPRSANSTEATMSAGPASAAASIRARDGGACGGRVASGGLGRLEGRAHGAQPTGTSDLRRRWSVR